MIRNWNNENQSPRNGLDDKPTVHILLRSLNRSPFVIYELKRQMGLGHAS